MTNHRLRALFGFHDLELKQLFLQGSSHKLRHWHSCFFGQGFKSLSLRVRQMKHGSGKVATLFFRSRHCHTNLYPSLTKNRRAREGNLHARRRPAKEKAEHRHLNYARIAVKAC